MTITVPAHILITGATGGLGRALALEYAGHGVRLTLCGRDEGRLALVADECRAQGAGVTEACLDVRESEVFSRWLAGVDRADPIDLAIANAGVSSSIGPDGQAENLEDVRRVFGVNTLGVVETLQTLAEPMRQRGHGQLAVVSSLAAMAPLPDGPSYSASKAAARMYGLSLRIWLKPYGVGVTVISPGYVETPLSRRYLGAKPFLISAEKAARRIRKGLAHNRAEIAFPFLLVLGLRCLDALPHIAKAWILRHFFRFRVVPDRESPRTQSRTDRTT